MNSYRKNILSSCLQSLCSGNGMFANCLHYPRKGFAIDYFTRIYLEYIPQIVCKGIFSYL